MKPSMFISSVTMLQWGVMNCRALSFYSCFHFWISITECARLWVMDQMLCFLFIFFCWFTSGLQQSLSSILVLVMVWNWVCLFVAFLSLTLILLEQLIFTLVSACVALLSGDSCAHGFLSLIEQYPGVGGWEVIHSKSGGHKTFCIKIESLQFPLFMLCVACLCLSIHYTSFAHT